MTELSSPAARSGPNTLPLIFGCGRSGTTLLGVMVDSHPQIAVTFDSKFLVDLANCRHDHERDGRLDVDGLLSTLYTKELYNHEAFVNLGIPLEELRETVLTNESPTVADVMRAILRLHAAARGKRHYADKTNRVAHKLSLFAELLPEARFVHLIRDGRDVALSYLDVDWGPNTWDEAARKWKKRVGDARRQSRSLAPGRYLELRYEALIDDTEGSLRRLCAFIGHEFDPAMLAYTGRAETLRAGLLASAEHRNLTRPPMKRLRDWRTEMPVSAQGTFVSIAGDLLEELGYQL